MPSNEPFPILYEARAVVVHHHHSTIIYFFWVSWREAGEVDRFLRGQASYFWRSFGLRLRLRLFGFLGFRHESCQCRVSRLNFGGSIKGDTVIHSFGTEPCSEEANVRYTGSMVFLHYLLF